MRCSDLSGMITGNLTLCFESKCLLLKGGPLFKNINLALYPFMVYAKVKYFCLLKPHQTNQVQ